MHPFYTIRLGSSHNIDFERDKIVDFLIKNKDICGEVWLTTESGHPKMEMHQKAVENMKKAARVLRENGITVSVQLSNTIGHGGDLLTHGGFEAENWQTCVSSDGGTALHSICPNDENFLKYLHQIVTAYAEIKPYCLWLDDDFRMSRHIGESVECFCDNCIEKFMNKYFDGEKISRNELVKRIHYPKDYTYREAWMLFNQDTLCHATEVICDALMKVSPNSHIGLEHYAGGSDLKELDFVKVLETMKKATNNQPHLRPGAVYWNDHNPRGAIYKSFYLNWQSVVCPDYVDDIRAEVENFPHTSLSKSPYSTVLESALYLAMGCSNLSYALFVLTNEPYDWHQRTMQYLREWYPFLLRYKNFNSDTQPYGLQIVFGKESYKQQLEDGSSKFDWLNFKTEEIFSISLSGIPISYNSGAAAILNLDNAKSMSDEELCELFKNKVITDGRTILYLEKRNLKYLSGLSISNASNSVINQEIMTSNKINKGFEGRTWATGFEGEKQIITDYPGYKSIGEYSDMEGNNCGTSAVVGKTPLGGRLAVIGYSNCLDIMNSAKRNQLLKAADYVSDYSIPVILESSEQMFIVPRQTSTGNLKSIFILNASIDCTRNIDITIRKPIGNNLKLVYADNIEKSLEYIKDGDDMKITLSPLSSWQCCTIEIS